MLNAPKISPAEWEILDVVWEKKEATGPEVYEVLGERTGWHQKTVNTFLARLVEKGILTVRRTGKANVHTPRLSREQCVRQESESFLNRVFRGATGPLLAHFCERAELTKEEIAELQALLEKQTKRGRKK